MVAATAYQFHKVDPLAGKLMLPYLGWVSFAAALTYTLTSMNSSKVCAWKAPPASDSRGLSGAQF